MKIGDYIYNKLDGKLSLGIILNKRTRDLRVEYLTMRNGKFYWFLENELLIKNLSNENKRSN